MSERIDLNTDAGRDRLRQLAPHLAPAEAAPTYTATARTFGARYCLCLPFHTARLNELMAGVKTKVGLRRRDNALVAEAAALSGIPQATGPRRVSLLVVLARGQRAGDRDGWFKSLLDALVHSRLLVDDGARHCELGPVTFARGDRAGMYVTLEELRQ